MALKALQMFLVVALAAYFMPAIYAKPKPRDSSVFVDQNVVRPSADSLPVPETEVKAYYPHVTEHRSSARISCQSEDAEEDPICQQHCLPKGYTYGICVSQTCSCI